MGYKRGILHLLPLLLILVLVVTVYLLIFKLIFKNKLPFIGKGKPTVELRQEYRNPLKKETQYVNPFDQYKNPLANLK